jgi:hypothetical protein
MIDMHDMNTAVWIHYDHTGTYHTRSHKIWMTLLLLSLSPIKDTSYCFCHFLLKNEKSGWAGVSRANDVIIIFLFKITGV